MKELRNAALEYANRGWHVLPLRAKGKQPEGRVVRHGLSEATDDLVTTLERWQPTLALQPYNIGVVANPSGLLILDVDPRHGGDETIVEAQGALGELPQTVEAETGGGGWHYYFRHPGGATRGKLGPGLDVRDHAYVVAPPSLHPSGRRYEWSVDGHPDEVEVAQLPQRWIDALQVGARRRVERDPNAPVSDDPLRRIPATTYIATLTGREPDARGFFQCPLHGGGNERTPSLKCDGHVWACYGCEATGGMRCAGGNIYTFMALLMNLPIPPRGIDYLMVKDRLKRTFDV